MNLFFIRHTEYSNPDHIYPYRMPVWLSDKGREHARKIGLWFEDNGFYELPIFTSPMVRTVQTAELIASKTSSFVQVDKKLNERWSAMQGQELEDWDLLTPEYLAKHKSESHDEMMERMESFWEVKVSEGKDIIAVSHGDLLTLFYEKMMDNPIDMSMSSDAYVEKGEILWFKIKNGEVIRMERISV